MLLKNVENYTNVLWDLSFQTKIHFHISQENELNFFAIIICRVKINHISSCQKCLSRSSNKTSRLNNQIFNFGRPLYENLNSIRSCPWNRNSTRHSSHHRITTVWLHTCTIHHAMKSQTDQVFFPFCISCSSVCRYTACPCCISCSSGVQLHSWGSAITAVPAYYNYVQECINHSSYAV